MSDRLAAIRCAPAVGGLALLAWASSCDQSRDPTPQPAIPASVEYLTPVQHLVRISMALRGTRPALAELDAVEEDPVWLPAIVEHYLDSPELGATIREMHAEQLLVDVDGSIYPAGFPAVGELADMDVQRINQSIVEAPLRLIEHVVTQDRPYHEVVTADYTLADPITSIVFGIPHDAEGPEWQVTHYEDGRPHAGVLSDSFVFTRHSSTFSNRNRGRANAIARAFLCYDFLDRHVEIDSNIDLADEEAVAHAIRENEACVSCHQTLDPLASHFAEYTPIFVPSQIEEYPFRFYGHPYSRLMRVTDPAFFGTPSSNAQDLGVLVASDPRFALCTARRFYGYLAQVAPEDVPLELASRLSDTFLLGGMNAKALLRAIVLSDEFRVASATDETEALEARGLLKARPTQIARMVQDLTGYRWTTRLPIDLGYGRVGDIDLMTDAFFGFEVLAGGTDSQSVTRPAFTMTATAALALRGLAAHAAPFAVDADFDESDPARRWLLSSIDESESDETRVRAQLAELSRRVHGERVAVDDPAVDALWSLWSGALTEPDSSTRRAWTMTLYAMLQDIQVAYY
ncbi:MAG: DUF1588 domain-containing protein [Deltaproteobacteria bacterium]|nr:DUF1588 domain-containing protein [Deltaproteobacteria bacterium]